MVLHNSKWDRKATRTYYKKHGIAPPPRKPHQSGTPNTNKDQTEGHNSKVHDDRDSGSGSDEGYEDDVLEEEINNPDNISSLVPDLPSSTAIKNKWDQPRRKVLTSNSWRYGDESGDVEGTENDERLMDEAQLEQLGFERAQQQIEQEELAFARSVKLDPREIDLNKSFQSVGSISKKKKKMDHYAGMEDTTYTGDQDADLSEFLVADDNEGSEATTAAQTTVKPKKGNIQKLEDKEEFYKLQREIEKSKAAKEIERKFGMSSKKNSTRSSNNKNSSMVSEEQNIDDFLSSIDELSINGRNFSATKPTVVEADELDELLAAATSGNPIGTSFPGTSFNNSRTTRGADEEKTSLFAGSQVQKKPTQKAVQYNEAWLDNLLN
ncbi:hypothetical protein D0Z03_000950 [Geotrichum reessii]|nr:hypothetical protein D0Z03_000950 [Galactomyces reessii]